MTFGSKSVTPLVQRNEAMTFASIGMFGLAWKSLNRSSSSEVAPSGLMGWGGAEVLGLSMAKLTPRLRMATEALKSPSPQPSAHVHQYSSNKYRVKMLLKNLSL